MTTTLTTAEADARAVDWVFRLGLKTQYDLLEDELTVRYRAVLSETLGDLPVGEGLTVGVNLTAEVVLPNLTVKPVADLTRDDLAIVAAFMRDFNNEVIDCRDGNCDCHTREIVD